MALSHKETFQQASDVWSWLVMGQVSAPTYLSWMMMETLDDLFLLQSNDCICLLPIQKFSLEHEQHARVDS